MAESNEVILQFTQEDRDCLRDISATLKTLVEKHESQHVRLNRHHKRIQRLENHHIRQRGMLTAVRWIWGAILGLGTWVGYEHITKAGK